MREATCTQLSDDLLVWCFNPRLPCGRRLSFTCKVGWSVQFQSTPPMREATRSGQTVALLRAVSIHASHAGGDVMLANLEWAEWGFNPRLPCGRRLHIMVMLVSFDCFNPRLPCGRRRPVRGRDFLLAFVSIHASHAGGDSTFLTGRESLLVFQSTPPMREATCFLSCFRFSDRFQSTPPMREATLAAILPLVN